MRFTRIKRVDVKRDKEILQYVLENYTTEDVIKRCSEAVVESFKNDYLHYKLNQIKRKVRKALSEV